MQPFSNSDLICDLPAARVQMATNFSCITLCHHSTRYRIKEKHRLNPARFNARIEDMLVEALNIHERLPSLSSALATQSIVVE